MRMLRQVFRAMLDSYTLSRCSWNRRHVGPMRLVNRGVVLRLRRCEACCGGYLQGPEGDLFVGPRVFKDLDKELTEMNEIYASWESPR